MDSVMIREPKPEDETAFLAMTQDSQDFHHPWVKAPLTSEEFAQFLERHEHCKQRSFLVCNQKNDIVGVFNISEIVRGCFQSAYLGFYVAKKYARMGFMQKGLQLILEEAFTNMKLHRLEANIQPENTPSLHLVKKGGFRKEGVSKHYLKINGEWRDHERWAITVEDR